MQTRNPHTKTARKKATERFYLETFMRLNDWPHQVDQEDRERPDFLLNAPNGTAVGVEITSLYKDEGPGGSLQRSREQLRVRTLRALCAAYYDSGRKPATVSVILAKVQLDEPWIAKLTHRLRMARPSTPWEKKRFRIDLGRNVIATFFITALPDDVGPYNRWTCVNNSVDYRRAASTELLSEKIKKKAEQLPKYVEAAQRTILLIVAEVTQGSGMFDFKPTPELLQNRGFWEVHLLLHPFKSYRIA